MCKVILYQFGVLKLQNKPPQAEVGISGKLARSRLAQLANASQLGGLFLSSLANASQTSGSFLSSLANASQLGGLRLSSLAVGGCERAMRARHF